MLRVKSLLLTFAFFGLAIGTTAQAQVLDPSDDGIVPELSKHYRNNRVVPYPYLRQDDMLWSERHWERIDLREKINLPHVLSRSSLCQIVRHCGMYSLTVS